MGSIFVAHREIEGGVQKQVALKLIRRDKDADDARVRFHDEAKVALRFSHPNVCSVFDYGDDDGVHYLAMELIGGHSVGALWRTAKAKKIPIPVGVACRIIADAARGLAYAHELKSEDGKPFGIVHRDICPANLMVTTDGLTKIIDFGIAISSERMARTRTGLVAGKPSYMAPEQAQHGAVDARSDLFSLGVVFWQLLTGELLFKRTSVSDTVKALVEDTIPDPRDLRDDVPASVVHSIAACLARDPIDRIASAHDVVRRLERDPAIAPQVDVAEFLASLDVGATTADPNANTQVRGSSSLESTEQLPLRSKTLANPLTHTVSKTLLSTDVVFRDGQREGQTVSAASPHVLGNAPRPIAAVVGLLAVVATAAGVVIMMRANEPLVTAPPLPPPKQAPPLVVTPTPAPPALPAVEPKKPKVTPRVELPANVAPAAIAPATVAPTGDLVVVAKPWGRVRIDGVDAGETPLRRTLPVGFHKVEVIAADNDTVRKEARVEIKADTEETLRVLDEP